MNKSKKIIAKERKAFLDYNMKEYCYDGNNVKMIIAFLSHMIGEYKELINY